MHIELLTTVVLGSNFLGYRDQFALAWTCRDAYKLIKPLVRAQVERVVAHLCNVPPTSLEHPSTCLMQHVDMYSSMTLAVPPIQPFTALSPVSVLERSLVYAILRTWFPSYGSTIVDYKSSWVCTANDAMLPTSLPNEDGRCRCSTPGEYTVIMNTHVFTHHVIDVHCMDFYFPNKRVDADALFDMDVMSKVMILNGKCDVDHIMTILGFYVDSSI